MLRATRPTYVRGVWKQAGETFDPEKFDSFYRTHFGAEDLAPLSPVGHVTTVQPLQLDLGDHADPIAGATAAPRFEPAAADETVGTKEEHQQPADSPVETPPTAPPPPRRGRYQDRRMKPASED